MRPVELVMHGFGAFRDRTVIGFDDTDFVAFVGPTGSGKSTVIDAMCFALYGSVPRLDNNHLVAPVISLGANEARVGLTFDAAGQRYQAVRVVRRRGGSGEARLERLGPDGSSIEVLAGTAKELTRAVERVLGLSFAHFTRCVVLPQGAFARLLHDDPRTRQDLLAELLDLTVYDQVGERARRRGAELAAQGALLTDRLARLADASPEVLADADTLRLALDALIPGIDAVAATIADLEVRAREARRDLDRLGTLARALDALAIPAAVRDADARVAESAAEAAEAAAALEVATAAADDARAALAALPPAEALTRLRDARARVRDLARRAAAAAEAATAADAALRTAAAVHTDAELAAATARVECAAAQHDHLVHAVATRLEAGRPCPVCDQTVTVVPARAVPAALHGAEARRDSAEAAAARTAEALRRAETGAASARERATGLHEQVVPAGIDLARAATPLADHLGPAVDDPAVDDPAVDDPAVDDPAVDAAIDAALDARRRAEVAVDAAERAQRSARSHHARAVAELDERRRVAAAAATTFQAVRDPLTALDPPPFDVEAGVLASWEALLAWAPEARRRVGDAIAAARQQAHDATTEHDRSIAAAASRLAELGVASGPGISGLREALTRACAEAEARCARLRERLAEVAELGAAAERLAADQRVAETLGRALRANGFERWLVAEALHRLVAGASATLHQLSGGQFSLTLSDQQAFLVVDHRNADETRLARTLSGGETFQASLAMALALADELTALSSTSAARLESVFIDEGFGTLDPEALDTVAATIETLAAHGERMVGIVTHVRDLAERVPVRYQVRKGPRSAEVERVVGG